MSVLTASIERLNLQRFFSGEGPQSEPVKLHQRKVYILPTRQGLFFALLLILMLVGSINYSNSLGYMLTFLLASLSVVSILFTYRNLLNLSVSTGKLQPVFCHKELVIPLNIENTGPTRYSVTISNNNLHTKCYDITPGTSQLSYSIPTPGRGYHPLPTLVFATVFPLGLFRAWSHLQVDKHYLVYPAIAGVRQLPADSDYRANQQGDQGRGTDDFAGQRKYHPGDSLRQVNWKALAREQGLLTKQFGGDRCEELWLDWQQTEGLGKEQRLSQLAMWIIEAEHAGVSYGLIMPGKEIAPAYGESHKQQCLEVLARF